MILKQVMASDQKGIMHDSIAAEFHISILVPRWSQGFHKSEC